MICESPLGLLCWMENPPFCPTRDEQIWRIVSWRQCRYAGRKGGMKISWSILSDLIKDRHPSGVAIIYLTFKVPSA